MSKKRRILPAVAIPGMFAVGALAAGAAGAGAHRTDQAAGAALTDASGDRSGSQLLSNTTVADPSASSKPSASADPNAGRRHGWAPGFRGGALDALVTDGTITADQKTKIVAAFDAKEASETEAEEAAEHADRAAWVSGVLDPLVSDGTITQGQGAKVKAALVEEFAHGMADGDHGARGFGGGHGPGGTALDALVTDGTITAEQQTKIVAAFQATESKETAEQEAAEHADRAAWISGILHPLVTDGTLTADEAAKVQAALVDMGPGRGPGGPGWGGDRGGRGHFGLRDHGDNGGSPDASPAPSDAPVEGSSANG